MFEALRPAVEQVLSSVAVRQETQFTQLVQDELSDVSAPTQQQLPDKEQLNKLYELRASFLDWELGTGYLGFFSKNPGTRYTFTKRLDAVFQMLPPLEGLRILEIGCGAGMLSLELASSAELVVGTDISFFVLDFANRVKDTVHAENVSFQHSDAENLTFQDESFDLVICSEVLEHLLDPEKALAEIRRVTKLDGIIILTTPSAASLSDLCMGVLRLFSKRIESEKDVQFDKKTYLAMQRTRQTSPEQNAVASESFMRVHERFSYKKLALMFKDAGLEIERAEGTIFAFPPHYQLFYRYCPEFVLAGVRLLEQTLNTLHIFQRFGSVTSCFLLKNDQCTL